MHSTAVRSALHYLRFVARSVLVEWLAEADDGAWRDATRHRLARREEGERQLGLVAHGPRAEADPISLNGNIAVTGCGGVGGWRRLYRAAATTACASSHSSACCSAAASAATAAACLSPASFSLAFRTSPSVSSERCRAAFAAAVMSTAASSEDASVLAASLSQSGSCSLGTLISGGRDSRDSLLPSSEECSVVKSGLDMVTAGASLPTGVSVCVALSAVCTSHGTNQPRSPAAGRWLLALR